ncbi:GNAT family N-acetyltransferase [Candidatus Halobonum tyrrellensis]|uniref:Acetyltransferase (Gnat) family protein n=1 Tax=Candidatus Halobonum tyrrellensis G22 TaxID=1324957 RepID=V4HHY3_9EURY|nr:GNAT family N-acetyltransferase [Candidatus Halobonum tyrrellensis]ESP87519.1 acetyltransferase (gnat) family protein [Candidatus Halobonum tyrrellensis G22]
MSERVYPDEPTGRFPEPPVRFEDAEGRDIEVRAYTGDEAEFEALVAMYEAFDPTDRAQGIPPNGESAVRSWLETILGGDCRNVVAWDGDDAAGHATLVRDDGSFELAIFVLQAYQGAGIGTRLIEALLAHGAATGVEKVWLTVERWNRPAVALYKNVGFETSDAESFELEMTARLVDSVEDEE